MGVRGPGETQLEVDRREINRRIAFLKRQLEDIQKHRNQYRRQRRKSAVSVIALVGYTNAGKSTLLNALTGAGVVAEDQLFATLDPTTRRVELASGRACLFTDTVGFIQKLPTALVASFRATLEEVTDADVLVHIVDGFHVNMDEQVAAVEEVLEELGAGGKPIVTAINKVDLIDRNDDEAMAALQVALEDYPNAVAISAKTGLGIDRLLGTLDEVLRQHMVGIDVLIPYAEGALVAQIHDHGVVDREEHLADGTHIIGRVRRRWPAATANTARTLWTRRHEDDSRCSGQTDSPGKGSCSHTRHDRMSVPAVLGDLLGDRCGHGSRRRLSTGTRKSACPSPSTLVHPKRTRLLTAGSSCPTGSGSPAVTDMWMGPRMICGPPSRFPEPTIPRST